MLEIFRLLVSTVVKCQPWKTFFALVQRQQILNIWKSETLKEVIWFICFIACTFTFLAICIQNRQSNAAAYVKKAAKATTAVKPLKINFGKL